MSNHANELDNPQVTMDRAALIKRKPLLKAFYEDAYAFFKTHAATCPPGKQLEIGSGAGFIKEVMPEVLTSEYMDLPIVDYPKCSALDMPFEDQELSAIYMMDVLHHLPDLRQFFSEANRALKSGGKIVMVEPANTPFGRFIYQNFHHEPFEPQAETWTLPEGGPLSMANGALPWIVFKRDKAQFLAEYPTLKIQIFRPFGPLLYAMSGGVGRDKQFVPSLMLYPIKIQECLMTPLMGVFGMFYKIVVVKTA